MFTYTEAHASLEQFGAPGGSSGRLIGSLSREVKVDPVFFKANDKESIAAIDCSARGLAIPFRTGFANAPIRFKQHTFRLQRKQKVPVFLALSKPA